MRPAICRIVERAVARVRRRRSPCRALFCPGRGPRWRPHPAKANAQTAASMRPSASSRLTYDSGRRKPPYRTGGVCRFPDLRYESPRRWNDRARRRHVASAPDRQGARRVQRYAWHLSLRSVAGGSRFFARARSRPSRLCEDRRERTRRSRRGCCAASRAIPRRMDRARRWTRGLSARLGAFFYTLDVDDGYAPGMGLSQAASPIVSELRHHVADEAHLPKRPTEGITSKW